MKSVRVSEATFALVPYIVFFVAEPHWLEMPRLGRYLAVFTAMCSWLLALQVGAAFQPQGISGGAARIQRWVAGALLGVIVISEIGADVWPGELSTPLFTTRLISFVPQVWNEAQSLLPLNEAQRQQFILEKTERGSYGRLIHAAHSLTPADENVVVLTRPDDAGLANFLLQRSYYEMYPRKVFVVDDIAGMTVAQLAANRVGTIIGYERDVQLAEGQIVYPDAPGFSVTRIATSGVSAQHTPNFIPASAQFAAGIQLLGYHLIPALLDDPLVLTLFWRSSQPILESYTVLVHVFAGDTFMTQYDSPPAFGLWPTLSWQPNKVIMDAHPLAVTGASASDMRFCVGLYSSTPSERVPILSADGYSIENNTACRLFPPP